jgi:hypothetical protein
MCFEKLPALTDTSIHAVSRWLTGWSIKEESRTGINNHSSRGSKLELERYQVLIAQFALVKDRRDAHLFFAKSSDALRVKDDVTQIITSVQSDTT